MLNVGTYMYYLDNFLPQSLSSCSHAIVPIIASILHSTIQISCR